MARQSVNLGEPITGLGGLPINVVVTDSTCASTVSAGDGFEQVSSFGINNARTSWQFARTDYLHIINEIYTFLLEHKGVTPFYMTVAGETKTYRTEGNIGRSHISGDVWQVSFTVKQVFIP